MLRMLLKLQSSSGQMDLAATILVNKYQMDGTYVYQVQVPNVR